MNTTVRRGAVVVLGVLSVACGSSGPTAPTETSQPLTLPPSTPQPPTDPPLSGPSRTFIFDRELSYRVSDYTKESRFVLYDNGKFVLQYMTRFTEHPGRYTEANGVIYFEWEGLEGRRPWGATGTVVGEYLTVQYSLNMQLADFENAVYGLME
jgi:hypothetical protein